MTISSTPDPSHILVWTGPKTGGGILNKSGWDQYQVCEKCGCQKYSEEAGLPCPEAVSSDVDRIWDALRGVVS